MTRRILVTSALPYANAHLHLGHMVEHVQTNIFVRFQQARGNECRSFCADDTHGTPIMVSARQQKRSEEEIIAEENEAHQRDFQDFDIVYDHYSSTNSPTNKELCHQFWQALHSKNLVTCNEVSQLYDTQEGLFLADRFVKGECPKCGAADQYGDNCEKCGATYAATDLQKPKSTISGSTPEIRTAEHQFVEVEKEHAFISEWTQAPGHLQPEVAKYLNGFFLGNPLRDWDVSRPGPYFGFEIPDHPGHYWYVWFDAPIGYVSTTQEWCRQQGEKLQKWWADPNTEIYHVIGKDIVYFHTLFWPTMLKAAGYTLPKHVHVHGFLTVNGEKMSKSRGTMIEAAEYVKHLDPSHLRYYFASKLSAKIDDIDLDFEDFTQKVNSDLVGKVVNLASRSARFIKNEGLSETYPQDDGLFQAAAAAGEEIAAAYESFDTARAMRLIMALADRANEYVDRMQPWALKKEAGNEQKVQDVCTVCLNLYRQLVIYLSPVLPRLATATEELLAAPVGHWKDASTPTVGHAIGSFKHLMQRVDPKAIEALVAASKKAEPPPQVSSAAQDDNAALQAEPLAPECSFDDFMKVDLRVARVVRAEAVPKAKKLLKLTLGLGGEEQRTVFAGIKSAYEPDALEGRLVVMVANLAPRQMKFGLSEGMVIAAGPGKDEIFLLSPDSGAKPGQRVH